MTANEIALSQALEAARANRISEDIRSKEASIKEMDAYTKRYAQQDEQQRGWASFWSNLLGLASKKSSDDAATAAKIISILAS